jgi:hypothetical protein
MGDHGAGRGREVDPDARPFTPHLRSPLDAELRRCSEGPPESCPAIDTAEAFLLAVFLRRYITYCARCGRYAAMNGAAVRTDRRGRQDRSGRALPAFGEYQKLKGNARRGSPTTTCTRFPLTEVAKSARAVARAHILE